MKNKRNHNINLNTMNHFNSIKESCISNTIYNKTFNNNNNILNIKKNFYKFISL